ncbi:hypothetical protein LCGC14_1370250 [marine sediment metagenome]|uniref:Radical SAM core domain-containing protein n=1 Tax=marine sediment metagenome TaxID=412755 RepID=A0A0F9N7J8_9ZZZZ
MNRVLLLQLDGKLPNIALMRVAAHHRGLGDEVLFRKVGNATALHPDLFDAPDLVYASTIFERTRPLAEHLLTVYPAAKIGGTGINLTARLEDLGIYTWKQDYSIYPTFQPSIGFSQRGCRLRCPFCVVPWKEGKVSEEQSIGQIWRGDPHPRHIILLDNDFFGQPQWARRIDELRDGGFRVNFSQGINARMLTDETAAALASVDYYNGGFQRRQLYTAWDNRKDEARLFRGLQALVDNGVRPVHIMVYILIGYWPGETIEDWEYRRRRLREFGSVPYPMPYVRTKEAVGFQRWVAGAYDKRIPLADWIAADYRPEKLKEVAA